MNKAKSNLTHMKKYWFTYLVLLVLGTFVIFPIFWMLSVSLRHNGDVFTFPAKFLPPEITFEAYVKVLTSPDTLLYFWNSYLNGALVTIIAMIIGIMAGYGLSRYEFRGKRIFNLFTVSTQTIPAVTLLIPFFIIMVAYGLYNTRLGLIVAYISFSLPYSIIMMTGYFNAVSKEIDEAARIDGASDFRTLWKIIVPITKPGIIATMIYIFILSWNEYIFATALIKDDALKTVPVGIALMKGETVYEWNTMMAMSIIGSIPVLIFYLLRQKDFVSGLTSGATKG